MSVHAEGDFLKRYICNLYDQNHRVLPSIAKTKHPFNQQKITRRVFLNTA